MESTELASYKEWLQHELIAFASGLSPQVPEELLDGICQAVVDWNPED